MSTKIVLMVEVDADQADNLPEHVTVWGQVDSVDAALMVLDRELATAA